MCVGAVRGRAGQGGCTQAAGAADWCCWVAGGAEAVGGSLLMSCPPCPVQVLVLPRLLCVWLAQGLGQKEWRYSWGAAGQLGLPQMPDVLSPSPVKTGLRLSEALNPYLYLQTSLPPLFQLILRGNNKPSKHQRKDLLSELLLAFIPKSPK